MTEAPSTPAPAARLFGRRKGRPLNKRKSALMENTLSAYVLKTPEEESVCDPFSLFSHKPDAVWFEIGFGGGEHIAAEADLYRAHGFIGCEPFHNGVASLLDHIDQKKLTNVRIYDGDARLLLAAMTPGSLSRVALLYPDPWPKKRHAERRFICAESLALIARAMKKGGELLMATDVLPLAEWMEKHTDQCDLFTARHKAHTPPEGWIPTRYEQKGIEKGRTPTYLVYQRN